MTTRPEARRSGRLERLITIAVLAVLIAATAYEAALAFNWLSVGPLPGETPVGYGLVLASALLALLVGVVLLAVAASRPQPRRDPFWSLVGPAAAAFVVTRFHSFDPYYAPTLRRMSEHGMVPDAWVYALVFFAVVAAILTRVRLRQGLAVNALVLLLGALTALAAGTGH